MESTTESRFSDGKELLYDHPGYYLLTKEGDDFLETFESRLHPMGTITPHTMEQITVKSKKLSKKVTDSTLVA
jgi:predicted transcriptional regulator